MRSHSTYLQRGKQHIVHWHTAAFPALDICHSDGDDPAPEVRIRPGQGQQF
jgi:hypothetical protein